MNPATNQIVGELSISTKTEVIDKVHQAHHIKKYWRSIGVIKRKELLQQLLYEFKKHEDQIISLTIQEMGKTYTETVADMVWDFDYFQAFLNHGPSYIEDEITMSNGKIVHRIVFEPRGVVACIVPWNFPFANFVWGVIPNLLVGNTVIFKHSEECPLLGKLIEDIINQSKLLPEGVFAEIYGKGDVGLLLVQQSIDMIWFTGSSRVGKELFDIAGKKQIKAILEMGGSNPAILFEDINVNDVIPKIVKGRFTNCGQVCDAIKRLIVHEAIANEVIDGLVEHVKRMNIGDPKAMDTELGPLAAMRQVELLSSQVEKSVAKGAKIVTGGKKGNLPGAYYLPTIMTQIDKNMPVWKEELFGPVLPVITFHSEEEAIQLANDTVYGLGAVVHSNNLERARRVARQIDAGFVDINDGNHWQPCNPFGGYKSSGMGCEHGKLGFQELCHVKVIAEG